MNKKITAKALYFSILLFILPLSLIAQTPSAIGESAIELTLIDEIHHIEEARNSIIISFGDKLNSEVLSISEIEDFSWKITLDETSEITGVGNKIFDVLFDKPGEYEIVFVRFGKSHESSCEHEHDQIRFVLKVLDEKFEFLFDELELSNSILGNSETTGIILSVPIFYSSYNESTGNVQGIKMISSGVNTTIKGELIKNDDALQMGKNTISFHLSGKAVPNTYIMFDFYRNDKLIQTYFLLNQIK